MGADTPYQAVLGQFDERRIGDPERAHFGFAHNDDSVTIANPLNPPKVMDGGVHGRQQNPKIVVAADNAIGHQGRDELGVGRQRLHERVDISPGGRDLIVGDCVG